jgi:hypothetical protein
MKTSNVEKRDDDEEGLNNGDVETRAADLNNPPFERDPNHSYEQGLVSVNIETSMADLNNNFLVAFEIGTRVHCPDLYAHYTLDQSPYDTGTVAKRHLKMVDIEYGVCMDCVKMLYNGERYFEKLDEPPLEILFTYGSRVECQIDGSEKWFPGVVLAFDDEFIQDNNHPYII